MNASSIIRTIYEYLGTGLGESLENIERSFTSAAPNVRVVLRRQICRIRDQHSTQPVSEFVGEQDLVKALALLGLDQALFTLARVYDAAHIYLCKAYALAKKGKPHDEKFLRGPKVDVHILASQLADSKSRSQDYIILKTDQQSSNLLRAAWEAVSPMSFDALPPLHHLGGLLPGEKSPVHDYAGIGGGGGSDIISASLLGHLLRRHGKEMHLLVSTRTWRTGSQGKKGSKMGIKREIRQHGGPAMSDGKAIAGTYLVQADTESEGRDLETIPFQHHQKIYIVLDQGEETTDIAADEKADVTEQFRAVLAQSHVDTAIVVDTGGDVFGTDDTGFSTPDQDLRVQRAFSYLSSSYNLVTAVLAPGVDAPHDAPEKALKAGGKVYKPTTEENKMLLDLLAREYRMDGSDPNRFGKTTLALQARFKGHIGWTSLNLPEHVVDTWENPWSSFVYIRECMSDVILIPLIQLLPLIEPKT